VLITRRTPSTALPRHDGQRHRQDDHQHNKRQNVIGSHISLWSIVKRIEAAAAFAAVPDR